jgi:serine/threonine-protein kinase
MGAIYDSIYAGPHWLKAVARANLGSVYLAAGRYADAERLLRQAADLYASALSPEDMNTGIARIKLGRALARQERWAEAERESRAGYDILRARTDPSVSWLQSARRDLADEYDALALPDSAARLRDEAAKYEKPVSK